AELEQIGEQAEGALRAALPEARALEYRRRVEALLERLERPPATERLRALRALAVLERIASPEARKVLAGLAAGAPADVLTREAGLAVKRLERVAASRR